jgi:hypothetical protein
MLCKRPSMSRTSKRKSSLAKHRTEPASSRMFISKRPWESIRDCRHSRRFHHRKNDDLRTPRHYVRSVSGTSLSSMLFAKLLSSTMTCPMMKELYDSIECDGVGDIIYLMLSGLSTNRGVNALSQWFHIGQPRKDSYCLLFSAL